MDINLFDYYLPEELIAQKPSDKRDCSRLLLVDKDNKTYKDSIFHEIVDYFQSGDVLVRNNTKVIPARLLGVKEVTHAQCELLLLKQLEGDVWECLTRPAKSLKVGARVDFGDGKLIGEVVEEKEEGLRNVKFIYKGIFMEVLDELGKMPLPPYIAQQLCSNDRYQTVYAKYEGSAAAPTAGFHFTEEIFQKLRDKGVTIVDVTLHIGLGTFRPVKVTDTKDHVMHSEVYEVNEEAAAILNKAKEENRRIIAVGTTSTRTLEANYTKYGKFYPTRESTNIFIEPGYTYKAIDCLVTNFHLPKSTLIMLVSAFMGREFTLEVYKHAVEERYRFFSFGDAMFIYAKNRNFQKELLGIINKISNSGAKPTLLLHACCGPCFTIPYEELKDYFKITVIYNNSNIYPKEEHDRRLEEFKRYLKEISADIELIEFPYDNITYNKDLEPYGDMPEGHERCRVCFRKRLEFGFSYAAKNSFDYFGTVMTISRYKNAKDINQIGYELEEKYAPTKWLPADFKKNNGYENSLLIIREHEMYFQEYCGCIFSYKKYQEKLKNR